MAHRCRCSRERVTNVLRSLKPEEIASLTVDGRIEARCEFCSRTQVFDQVDIAALQHS